MLVAETALLLAIRNTLRSSLTLRSNQCDVELDDQLPPVAEELYFTVAAAGCSPGPRHSSSGGVWDLYINVRVSVYQRCTHVARDRKTDLFLDLVTGLNARLDSVIRLIDNSYALTADAKALLTGTTAAAGEFPEPFRTFQPDTNFRTVAIEPYSAAQMGAMPADPVVGLMRGVTFNRARFMSERA